MWARLFEYNTCALYCIGWLDGLISVYHKSCQRVQQGFDYTYAEVM